MGGCSTPARSQRGSQLFPSRVCPPPPLPPPSPGCVRHVVPHPLPRSPCAASPSGTCPLRCRHVAEIKFPFAIARAIFIPPRSRWSPPLLPFPPPFHWHRRHSPVLQVLCHPCPSHPLLSALGTPMGTPCWCSACSALLPPPPQCRHTIALNHPKPPVGFPLCCGGAEWDRPQCKGCIGGVGGGGGGALPCDIASTPSSKRAPFPHVDPNLKEGAEGGGEALQTGESCSFWVGIACLGLFGVYWWEGSDVGSPHLLVPWGDPQPPHELILSFSLCVPTVKKAKFDGPQGEWASGGWGGGQRDPKLILLGDITRIVWGGGERDRGSLGRTMGGHSRGGVGGGTGWSLHPLLCSRREVQHLCDAEGAECQKYHHRSAGQPACLGAGLHVVSAPTPTGTPAPLFPVPHRDLMLLLASSTCGPRDPPTPLLPSSSGSPHPCFYL